MSHFSLLVVTDKEPTNAILEAALWPFHEFECTGEERYIVEVDQTDEARKEYVEDTTRFYVDPNGVRYEPYADRFYRDPLPGENVGMGMGFGGGISWNSKDWGDGRGYRAKVHFLPDGWSEVNVPTPEVTPFREWAEGYYGRMSVQVGDIIDTSHADACKYGYLLVDSVGEVIKVIDRTNPDKQWDYWTIGGRYSNRLTRKGGIACDSCRISDLDHAGMARQRRAMREETWVEYQKDLEKGRSEGLLEHLYGIKPGTTKDQYINTDPGLSSFAMLKDGRWYEKGSMGWWGVVCDDKGDEWRGEFADLMGSLQDDQWITFVDCHI
jgi:hypothetical protein